VNITFDVPIPKMDGREVSPGVFIIGEPTYIGAGKFTALADMHGALVLIELVVRATA
jgi:hypothetical protein